MKPKGYWTKEKCQEEALKYNRRTEFQINSGSAYVAAQKNKWLIEICSHMENIFNYWDKEKCQMVALKYKTKKNFRINHKGAYENARLNGFLDEICSHMISPYKPSGYWTKERCSKVAFLCDTRSIFAEKYCSAYNTSVKNNWLDEICSHMISPHKEKGYWNKEKCKIIASGCTYRNEFQQNYKIAYNKSLEKGWLDEICSHMIPCGNLNKRLIYAFIFPDNNIYIGLTCNIERREKEHLYDSKKNTTVYKHINETNIYPKLIKLTEYIDVDVAIIKEKYYIDFYKNLGYKILNKNKGGTIGYGGKNSNWNHKTHKRKKVD